VLGDGRRHFEQAIFADRLTDVSVREARAAIAPLWKELLAALVPLLESKVARDSAAEQATHRLRVGFYTFDADTRVPATATPPRKTRKRS
jgi:hypothetical protein